MAVLLYFLLLVAVVGLLLTLLFLFKFLASISSLIGTTNAAARESKSVLDHLTGNFFSMGRVLGHKGNRHARALLFRHAAIFCASFIVTIGSALLLIEMTSELCVFNKTATTLDTDFAEMCAGPQ